MNITRRGFLCMAGIGMLGIAGCSSGKESSEPEKNIPGGMTEAAYDLGKEVYDLAGSYTSGDEGFDTVGAKVKSAIDDKAPSTKAKESKQDERIVSMCAMISAEFSTADKDSEYTLGNIKTLRDGLGYTIETGEYSDDFKSMDS